MKKILCLLSFFSFFFFSIHVKGQKKLNIPIKLKNAMDFSRLTKNPTLIGQFFIGTPYVSNRLSRSNPEKVYFSFLDFDCVTFVENVLALYHSDGSKNQFELNLINYRYKDSINFEGRNHYLTSGLEKLVKLEIVSPINHVGNSKSLKKNIRYLSQHLTNVHIDKAKIMAIEKSISNKVFYYFDSVTYFKNENSIMHGDIIAFLTTLDDLDFQHVGFVFIKDNKKYILHASQENKKVCISNLTIYEYLLKHKKLKGFQIYRPNI